MGIGVRVVVIDLGTGACRAEYVIDHNLRVELHDLDTSAGVGIEVLGAKDLVQPDNDQSRDSQHDHQHERYPRSCGHADNWNRLHLSTFRQPISNAPVTNTSRWP